MVKQFQKMSVNWPKIDMSIHSLSSDSLKINFKYKLAPTNSLQMKKGK